MLLPKLASVTPFWDFRGLALLDVCSTLYSRMLISWAKGFVWPRSARHVLQLAHTKRMRTAYVTLAINCGMRKCAEWQGHVAGFVFFSGDVYQAFDHLSIEIVEAALR